MPQVLSLVLVFWQMPIARAFHHLMKGDCIRGLNLCNNSLICCVHLLQLGRVMFSIVASLLFDAKICSGSIPLLTFVHVTPKTGNEVSTNIFRWLQNVIRRRLFVLASSTHDVFFWAEVFYNAVCRAFII